MMEIKNTGDEMIEIKQEKVIIAESETQETVLPESEPDETVMEAAPAGDGDPEKNETLDAADEINTEESEAAESEIDEAELEAFEKEENAGAHEVNSGVFETDDFENDFLEVEEADNDLIHEIGDSLSRQADNDLDSLSDIADDESENDEEEEVNRFTEFIRRIPWWGYSLAVIVLAAIIIPLWFYFSDSAQKVIIAVGSNQIADGINYEPVEKVPVVNVEIGTEDSDNENVVTGDDGQPVEDVTVPNGEGQPAVDLSKLASTTTLAWPTGTEDTYNLLIICEENLKGETRGSADAVMALSVNKNTGKASVISFLKDSLVAIPYYGANILGSVYKMGSVALMYEVFKSDYLIKFDNYAVIRFDSFRYVVDFLNGLDVDLTKEEADYLNRTNYISLPENRNVSEGKNHLNGDQVLGYSRISAVKNDGGEAGDYARTARQRIILDAIRDRLKDMNAIDIAAFIKKCLPLVTSDLTAEDVATCTELLIKGADRGLAMHRIPVNGSFDEITVNGAGVLAFDTDKNAKAVISYLYEE